MAGQGRIFGFVRAGGRDDSMAESATTFKLRLLLIDDDQDIRDLLRATLSDKYEIAEAENGMVGLSMIEKFQPDLVICDVMMPVLNGLETVEAIRQHPVYADLPVFFLTGEKSPALPELARSMGVNLFLPKPIEPSLLDELIELYVVEMKIQPRSREPLDKNTSISVTAMAGQSLAAGGPVRILVIDDDPTNLGLLEEILGRDQRERWEVVWSKEPMVAVSNLARLEPDIILYNPRQRAMNGIQFARFLQQKKLTSLFELAFVGNEFKPEEEEFSRMQFARQPLRSNQARDEFVKQLAMIIQAAQPKIKLKRFSLEEILKQDSAHRERLQAERAEERARRQQTSKMQAIIDQRAGHH